MTEQVVYASLSEVAIAFIKGDITATEAADQKHRIEQATKALIETSSVPKDKFKRKVITNSTAKMHSTDPESRLEVLAAVPKTRVNLFSDYLNTYL